MGDNPMKMPDNPLKTLGAVVFTRICFIHVCINKYLKKGLNSVRKGQMKLIQPSHKTTNHG